jgi:glycosyltransferase involved in cell wall biosynthesis
VQVLWFSHLVPYPPKSGALLRAYYLLRAVAARHQVDLVALIQEPLLASFYPSLDEALADCHAKLAPICRSVNFLRIDNLRRPLGKLRTAAETLFTRDGYVANCLYSHATARTVRELCASRHYDIAHFDHEGLALYRDECTATHSTLGHHNAESHMMFRRAENSRNPLAKLYFWQEAHRLRRFEARISTQFAAHIVCSDLDGERLREVMTTARVHTIPNGVDTAYFQPLGTAERSNSLVFVGSMNWYPNVDAVLFLLQEIWPLVVRDFPSARLDIVGANAPESIKRAAKAHPGVTVHGYVDDIRPMVDSAALYVCPIRDGGGTKLKVLDALAMAKCIVAHPIACEGIAVTPGRDIVYASTAEEFADGIGGLFRDAAERSRIGAAARTLAVEHYSFASIGAGLSSLLEGIASGG